MHKSPESGRLFQISWSCIYHGMPYRPKTARTRNSKRSHIVVNAELMVLVRTAIRPSKKLGLQSTAENWQWWRCPNWLRQTVPNRRCSCWEGTVANGSTQGEWSDDDRRTMEECSCRRALRSETRGRSDAGYSRVSGCRAVEAAIHQHFQPEWNLFWDT